MTHCDTLAASFKTSPYQDHLSIALSLPASELTHWARDKIDAILCTLLNETIWISLKFIS